MPENPPVFKCKYFYLAILLLGFFITNPFLTEGRISNMVICFYFSVIIFISIYTVSKSLILTSLAILLAIASFVTYSYTILTEANELVYLSHFIINILFLCLITISVIGSIIRHRTITTNTLFGAICGYLLIGFIWSFIYLAIVSVDPNSFSIQLDHDAIRARIDHFIYYSFVTLTTTGYGDILATKSVARTFSWVEAVVGQIYLAVWIAQLVGLRIVNARARNQPEE